MGQSKLPCRSGNLRVKFFWTRSLVSKISNTSDLGKPREDNRKPGRETAGKPVLPLQIINNLSSMPLHGPTNGEVNDRIGAQKEE